MWKWTLKEWERFGKKNENACLRNLHSFLWAKVANSAKDSMKKPKYMSIYDFFNSTKNGTSSQKWQMLISLPRWAIIIRYFREEIFKTDTICCREFWVLFSFAFLLLIIRRRTLSGSSAVWVFFLFAVGKQQLCPSAMS